MDTAKKPFETILNFRDVGQTVNAFIGNDLLQTGKLYRAARPDEASSEDRRKLVNEYGIKTIIDLRTKSEHVMQAKKRGAPIRSSAAVPQSNEEAAQPLRIPRIHYYDVNFNGSAYSRSLISQLSWGQFGKLVGLMALGYRTEGIAVLGRNVMQHRGLVGLAIDSVDVCGHEVYQLFEIISDPVNYPIMIHCTQGKDRTGLTAMLVLFLLDVPLEAVEHDYMLSQQQLVSEREARLREIRSIGLTDEFADCSPELVTTVHQHLLEKYGSVKEYLFQMGVTDEMQERIHNILSASSQHRTI